MNIQHSEWTSENSLTASEDRDRNARWRPDQHVPHLNNQELTNAMDALNNTSFVEKFPRVERTYADPPLHLQMFGLISFTPAKGATPNENGVYGFAKLRGNFATQTESDQRAEYLIRNVDSYHQIYHTYVGRPFPITCSSKYSADTKEIDIRKEMVNTISTNIKEKKDEEQKVIQEIKQREEALVADTKSEQDPYDEYITQIIKY